jgi:acetate kinase
MKVLVLNCGSSSLKFRLFEMDTLDLMAAGMVERIGAPEAALIYRVPGRDDFEKPVEAASHETAIDLVLRALAHPDMGVVGDIHEIGAVGHRVVHGAAAFTMPTLIDEAVLLKIRECIPFAPLHNTANVQGIEASLYLISFARQVAVFDTAFHQTLEPEAFLYALPYEWYENRGIRRYGFHGTSHGYVSGEAADILGRRIEDLKMITCHLGSGASVAAIDGGRSVDTSTGFTAVEGLVMGTRPGDIDSGIVPVVMAQDGLTPDEMTSILNRESGLRALTGGDNDVRVIEEKAAAGSHRHEVALKVFARRVKKYIGAYAAVMGGLDCLVFTAGIGENSPRVRSMVCEGLEFLGIELDRARNRSNSTRISRGATDVLVVPTDEELAIALEVVKVLEGEPEPQAIRPATEVESAGRGADRRGRAARRILTVDDNPDIRETIAAILETEDYEVHQAATMKEGIGLVAEVGPDLILLDVMMEDISAGFRFAKELRELERVRHGRRIPILMVTGVESVTDLRFRHRVGTDALPVDGFLEKPIDPELLLRKVKELMD